MRKYLSVRRYQKLKFFAVLLCLLLADTAWAEWSLLHEDEEILYFVDPSSKNALQRPRIAILREFRRPDAAGNHSARLLYEADCENKQLRLMSGVYLKKSMGNGEVSGMINSNGWMNPANRPVLQKIYVSLCDKS